MNISWGTVWQLAKSVGLPGTVAALISFVINVWYKNKLDLRKEQFKSELERGLARKSIVYETQKSSFKSIIGAMNQAIRAIEQRWDPGEEEFRSIKSSDLDAFQSAISQELLFVPSEGAQALGLFYTVMSDAVFSPTEMSPPSDETVRSVLEKQIYLRNRVLEYFQGLVDVAPNPSALSGADYLGACILLSSYNDPENGWPTGTVLRVKDQVSPEEIVDIAGNHRELLIAELKRFAQYLRSDPRHKTTFYERLLKAENYLSRLEERAKR